MSGASINISPTQGFDSHIGVNRIANANGTWQSGATVSIGSTTLSQYNYSNTFNSIGGGSVGLSPYRLHETSCEPVNGGIATSPCPGTNVEVRLRRYGPLTWNTASGQAATITRRIACSGGTFTSAPNVSNSNFTLVDDDTSASEPLRTLRILYPFAAGYEYKVVPTANLKCLGGSAAAVVWDADYVIRIKSSCTPDIAGSGGVPNGIVDVDDLLKVINDWGTCTNSCCIADIVPSSGNGVVDVDDLLAVINGWGVCPSCDGDAESMPQSIQDCMERCDNRFPGAGEDWADCVDTCVRGLCEAEIIECDD
jgi:hypothetical protein